MVQTLWILCAAFALTAGITDLRWRKIPNWLTYPAAPVAILLHGAVAGRHAALLSFAGLGLGLAILLPLVLLRALGGGDWKLIGGLGAFFEVQRLIPVLFLALIINGVMALALVIWQRRLRQTASNLWRMGTALFLRTPNSGLTIDNPEAAKVPFGIAAAIAVLLYVAGQPWVAF